MPNIARIKKICRSVAYALCARLRLSEVYSVNKFNVVSNCLINSSRMITDKRNGKTLKRLLTLLDDNMKFDPSVENIAAMVREEGDIEENMFKHSVEETPFLLYHLKQYSKHLLTLEVFSEQIQ